MEKAFEVVYPDFRLAQLELQKEGKRCCPAPQPSGVLYGGESKKTSFIKKLFKKWLS